MGAVVTVESPFPEYALPRLWQWISSSRNSVCDDFSPKNIDELVVHWERKRRAGERTWGVFRSGDLGGMISSSLFSPILADIHCIFKRSFWGHETTFNAMNLVAGEIFSREDNEKRQVQKITSMAFFDNHALFGLVKKLGFVKEGSLRQHALRDGKLVDVVIGGLTRERFYEFTSEPDGQRSGSFGQQHQREQRHEQRVSDVGEPVDVGKHVAVQNPHPVPAAAPVPAL